MMNEIDVWGQDSDLGDLEDLDGSTQGLTGFSVEVLDSENADDACDPLWNLSWSMRRILWPDLIPTDRVNVRFLHSHESGSGTGPITMIRTKAGEDSDLSFSTRDFENSDTMHMEYGAEPGLFGWPELSLTYLSFEEHDDSDLYEHSFDAEARVDVEHDEASASWSDLDAETQKLVMNAILAGHAIQMEEFEELIVAGTDVLPMIAIHPGTLPETLSLGESMGGPAFTEGLALR